MDDLNFGRFISSATAALAAIVANWRQPRSVITAALERCRSGHVWGTAGRRRTKLHHDLSAFDEQGDALGPTSKFMMWPVNVWKVFHLSFAKYGFYSPWTPEIALQVCVKKKLWHIGVFFFQNRQISMRHILFFICNSRLCTFTHNGNTPTFFSFWH